MNQVYEVKTNLDPETLTEVAIQTYMQWLAFALGKADIGGRTLAHPSGRYAASLSWRKTGEASIAIIADEKIAPEAGWIEEGRTGADMKAAMLAGGQVGKDGYRYRDVPIRPESTAPDFSLQNAINNASGGHLPAKVGRMWTAAREGTDPGSRFIRMTDKPGSSAWKIPDMPAYSPAASLAALLRSQIGS